jgi:pyrimidine-nucleoside phosphorylase
MINAVEIIRTKRDGGTLSEEQITTLITNVSNGTWPNYQATAFLMAVYFNGMNAEETAALTRAMMKTGTPMTFDGNINYVDKHSTGGVGDKISLILAPLAAAMGMRVPMVAGRGLGHTGGTLDKLEAIPGFSVRFDAEDFKAKVETVGVAIMGQTDQFVPADKLLYALRDVTATVDCVPLITASILSKKASEGIGGLVLDIKVGSGAFMKTMPEATRLAKSLMSVGKELGLKVRALITDMNQPLGIAVGNSIEVMECVQLMRRAAGLEPIAPACCVGAPSHYGSDILQLTIELAAHMAVVSGLTSSLSAARVLAKKTLSSPATLKKFSEMCRAQGATIDVTEDFSSMPVSHNELIIQATRRGYVSKIDGEELGQIVVDMGGGRHRAEDKVDPSVGLVMICKVGDQVDKGSPLLKVLLPEKTTEKTTDQVFVDNIAKRALKAFTVGPKPVPRHKLIHKVLT